MSMHGDVPTTAAVFERDRYVVLPSLLKQPSLGQFYRYACKSAESNRMVSGDGQVDGTPSAYGDFMMDGLLNSLRPELEAACGLELFPTYSYFRVYKHGDTLAKHSDRPACEISVSLCLGFEEERAWPIWIECRGGSSSVDLAPGDALLYRGMECPHWRDGFEGTLLAQVFLHYVDQKGPNAEWRFDKRTSTEGLGLFARGRQWFRSSKPRRAELHKETTRRSAVSELLENQPSLKCGWFAADHPDSLA